MSTNSTPAERVGKVDKDRLFPKSYWSRPRPAERRSGDPTDTQIFAAVGRALTSWEQSQDRLSDILMVMSSPKRTEDVLTIRRIFGTIENIGGREAAILEVAEIYLGHHWESLCVRRPINALLKEVRLANFVRNDIAHGQVCEITSVKLDETGSESKDLSGYLLLAPQYSSRNNHLLISNDINDDDKFAYSSSEYRYSSTDLQEFASKFDSINVKTFGLIGDLQKDPKTGLCPLVTRCSFPKEPAERQRDFE